MFNEEKKWVKKYTCQTIDTSPAFCTPCWTKPRDFIAGDIVFTMTTKKETAWSIEAICTFCKKRFTIYTCVCVLAFFFISYQVLVHVIGNYRATYCDKWKILIFHLRTEILQQVNRQDIKEMLWSNNGNISK